MSEPEPPAAPAESPPAVPPEGELQAPPEPEKKKKKKKRDEFGSGRAVETLFKIIYREHVELTALADTKANIMVGINGLLTSVSLGLLVPRLGESLLRNAFPVLVLVLGCSVSLVCAILAARPRISSSPVSLADVRENRANILFFGHFTRLSSEEYVEGMHDLMEKPRLLFDEMSRDVHGLGAVLTRKYRLLRASYSALLLTVVASVGSALAMALGLAG